MCSNINVFSIGKQLIKYMACFIIGGNVTSFKFGNNIGQEFETKLVWFGCPTSSSGRVDTVSYTDLARATSWGAGRTVVTVARQATLSINVGRIFISCACWAVSDASEALSNVTFGFWANTIRGAEVGCILSSGNLINSGDTDTDTIEGGEEIGSETAGNVLSITSKVSSSLAVRTAVG